MFTLSRSTRTMMTLSFILLASLMPGAYALGSVPFDFTGDGKADLSVYNPDTHEWRILDISTLSPMNPPVIFTYTLGAPGDKPVPADYDGDMTTDIAVFNADMGNWYIRNSGGVPPTSIVSLGMTGDIPVPGDYDGDGKADVAVWRPSNGNWYIIYSSTGNPSQPTKWGNSDDKPVPGDYDGDLKTDMAIYRVSNGSYNEFNFYVIPSSGLPLRENPKSWGVSGDLLAPADYDGDLKTEFVIYRPDVKRFYLLNSATNTVTIKNWGQGGDVLVAADYGGDGKADIAVYRPSSRQWWILQSHTNTLQDNGTLGVPPTLGADGDIPLPSVYIADPIIP